MSGESEGKQIAGSILKLINLIFSEDKKLVTLDYTKRHNKRLEKIEPLFDQLLEHLHAANLKTLQVVT